MSSDIEILHNVGGTGSGNGNGNGKVDHIIHISDIHIRQGDLERARYTEYKHVLNGFTQEISKFINSKKKKTSDSTNTIIVMTGDIFHNKGKMDTPAIKLFFRWMDKLLNLAPVFMICGNHDFRQEDPHHPDMIEVLTVPYISAVAENKVKYPLFYLKESGRYVWHNIGFGLVSVKDTLRVFNTAGILSNLPDFPSPDDFPESVDHKIALFHGTLLPYGTDELKNIHGYRLEWFAGYDAVLLGDNHVQQTHRSIMKVDSEESELVWGYPGSLIQQNFGETPFGHGYLLWTLGHGNGDGNTIQVVAKHILNDYGMLSVKKQKNSDVYNVSMSKKETLPITEAVGREMFPRHPKIRVIGKTGEDAIVKELFEAAGITPESLMVTIPIDDKEDNDNLYEDDINGSGSGSAGNVKFTIDQMADINHTEKWLEFLKLKPTDNADDAEEEGEGEESDEAEAEEEVTGDNKDLIVAFINHPQTMRINIENMDTLPKEIVQKIKVRNAKIDKALEEYKDLRMQHHGENHKIILKNMAWDYVMCYGPSNYFDFETLDGKVALLNGRNAIGKSAFLDVLCIGLYGEPSKQRSMTTGKKMTGKMIHDHRPANVTMSVSIMFNLNGELYEVFRSFSQQAREENWARPISSTVCTVKLGIAGTPGVPGENSTKTIVCEGTLMVDEWIKKRFGTIDDILMSTFVSQIETNNFFHLKQDEQKAILDKSLHLESIAAYGTLLKEAILAYNDITTMIANSKSTLEDLIKSRRANVKEPASLKDKIEKSSVKLQELNALHQKLLILVGNTQDLESGDGAGDGAGAVTTAGENLSAAQYKKQIEKAAKKLASLGAITEEDKKSALMIQGEQKAQYMALRDEKAALGEPTMDDISLQKIRAMVDEAVAACAKHTDAKPTCNLSSETLKKQVADLNKWESAQPEKWLEDPDSLEAFLEVHRTAAEKLDKKYAACIQKPARMPSVNVKALSAAAKKEIDTLKALEAEGQKITQKDLETAITERTGLVEKRDGFIKTLRTQPRSLDTYAKWKADYDEWCGRVKGVRDLEESLEDLRKRYNDYLGYLATIRNKKDSQTMYTHGLEQIDEQLEELNIDNLPFNPECWACKALPTRERHTDLCNKKNSLLKEVQKIVKYLKKLPSSFDLEAEQANIDELEITIRDREYYEKTAPRMESESTEWESVRTEWKKWKKVQAEEEAVNKEIHVCDERIAALEHYLWDQWQLREKTLKKNCENVRGEIVAAEQFMKEYDVYSERQRFLEDEERLHARYEEWETGNAELIQKRDDYDLELRRKLLDEKFTKWQSDNNMRVDLVDKIRTYEALEREISVGQRMLNYIEMKSVAADCKAAEAKVKEYSNDAVRYEKELEDIQKIMENMKTYEAAYTTLLARKDALTQLENRFIGEKNGEEGYKEWVYKHNVIPLIEKEINRFLSLIDTIRLKITYSNKSFQYMVIDRGNTPTLAMSSGYQRFIIGISLRLAFACIGATGQNIRHLFIDEGFVACDAFNLEKVQSMLHKMMEYGGYSSIILMSHLEAIRDAADMSIDIHREGLFSNIRWGKAYPRLTKLTPGVNEVKKKGRPSKKTTISTTTATDTADTSASETAD
jgi:DNA repair exonuclease SbcCD ATPase subunit/DNA repair exonuclease SbcCD nuclease subunit